MEHLQKMLIPSKQEDKQLVDARLLHERLNSGQEFANWIKNRIKDYGFEEGLDFLTILSKTSNGRPRKEYHVSMDMAKELAMLERTEQGRTIRKYFIAAEKALRQQALAPAKQHYTVEQVKKEVNKVHINGQWMYAVRQARMALGMSPTASLKPQREAYPACFVQIDNVWHVNEEYLNLLVKRANARPVLSEAKTTAKQAQSPLPKGFGQQSLIFAAYPSNDDLIN